MKRLSFLAKTQELLLYTDRYQTVTLFEISQLYGSSLCILLIFLLSLPLLVFSTMWVVLPISFCILILGCLAAFDERLWLLDSLKRQAVPSPILKKVTVFTINCLEKVRNVIPDTPFLEPYAGIFRIANPLILMIAGFEAGFIQSPNTSYWTVLSLIFVSLGSITDKAYIFLAGYVFFLIGF
ncbi:MAG: exopolysaccharide biosynthesis protein [Chlamydiales bacterium]|nr:exopolysaccharide biosynthesis protein [Chlamydiales bacterium]